MRLPPVQNLLGGWTDPKTGQLTDASMRHLRSINTALESITGTSGHIAVFDSTGTQLADSGKVLPTGDILGTTDTQNVSHKTLDNTNTINGTPINAPILTLAPVNAGTFTMAAAATKVVSNTAVKATSLIVCFPANLAAATMVQGAKSPYILAADYVVGVSFTVKTQDGAAAVGGEIFNYLLFNV